MREQIDIIIFGVGGVGSWLADWLIRADTKEPFIKTLTIVDHDRVEEKNLQRQNYDRRSIGMYKVIALKDKLSCMTRVPKTITVPEEITKPEQLLKFNKEAIAIITTDNQKSKNMIADYFNYFLIGNCDHDFSEIKDELDSTDKNTWTIQNGYTSLQDIQSNIRTAQLLLTAILETKVLEDGSFKTKVQSEKWTEGDNEQTGLLKEKLEETQEELETERMYANEKAKELRYLRNEVEGLKKQLQLKANTDVLNAIDGSKASGTTTKVQVK